MQVEVAVSGGRPAVVEADYVTWEAGSVVFWLDGTAVVTWDLEEIAGIRLGSPRAHTPERTYSVDEIRKSHPSAYARWTADEDDLLLTSLRGGAVVAELAHQHGRQEGAIRSRLRKLLPVDDTMLTRALGALS